MKLVVWSTHQDGMMKVKREEERNKLLLEKTVQVLN